MKTALALALLMLTACAHEPPTIYHYCTEHEKDYSSYEECYQEVKAERDQEASKPSRAGAFFQGFANGYNSHPKPQPTSCYTIDGITSCH